MRRPWMAPRRPSLVARSGPCRRARPPCFALLPLAACAAAPPPTSAAADAWAAIPGQVEVVVAGLAHNDAAFDAGGAAFAAGVGFRVTEAVVVGARQTITFADDGHDTSVITERLAFDLVAPWQLVRPFLGGSLGFARGESVNETRLFGAHAGVNVYLRPETFLQVLAGYDEFFTTTEDETETLRHGQWTVSIGTGVVF